MHDFVFKKTLELVLADAAIPPCSIDNFTDLLVLRVCVVAAGRSY